MNVCDHEIVTPKDSPWAFDPAWRHLCAKALTQDRPQDKGKTPFHAISTDGYVRVQCQLLRGVKKGHKPLLQSTLVRSAETAFRIFTAPGDGSIKSRLEALLLCSELDMRALADLLSLPHQTILAYERIYYNVRDDLGMVTASPWLREFFATQGRSLGDDESVVDPATYWKLLAFEGGYRLLAQNWKWPMVEGIAPERSHDELKKSVVLELERRVRTGNLGSTNLVMLYTSLNPPQKGDEDANANDQSMLNFFYEMMKGLTPTTHLPTDTEMLGSQEALMARIETMQTQSSGGQSSLVSEMAVRDSK